MAKDNSIMGFQVRNESQVRKQVQIKTWIGMLFDVLLNLRHITNDIRPCYKCDLHFPGLTKQTFLEARSWHAVVEAKLF